MATSSYRSSAVYLGVNDGRPVPIYSTLTGPEMLSRNIISKAERRRLLAEGKLNGRPLTKFEKRCLQNGITTKGVHEAMIDDMAQSEMLGEGIAEDEDINRNVPAPFSRHVRPLEKPIITKYRPAYSFNDFLVKQVQKSGSLGLTQREVIEQETQLDALHRSDGRVADVPAMRRPGVSMSDKRRGANDNGRGPTNFIPENMALAGPGKDQQAMEYMMSYVGHKKADNAPGNDEVHRTRAAFTNRPSPRLYYGQFDKAEGVVKDPNAFNFDNSQSAVANAPMADPQSTLMFAGGNSRKNMGGRSLISAEPTAGFKSSTEKMRRQGDSINYYRR